MKSVVKKSLIALTALVALGLVTGASAQTRPSGDATTPNRVDDAQRPVWSPDSGALETGKLIGTRVQTADGKEAGRIDQLIVNDKDGKITHTVLSKGGVLGVGGTKLAVKWSDIKLQRDPDHEDRLLAVVDPAKLEAAPRYEARRTRDTSPAASPATPPASDKTTTPSKKN